MDKNNPNKEHRSTPEYVEYQADNFKSLLPDLDILVNVARIQSVDQIDKSWMEKYPKSYSLIKEKSRLQFGLSIMMVSLWSHSKCTTCFDFPNEPSTMGVCEQCLTHQLNNGSLR
jgi:hypothetical protein